MDDDDVRRARLRLVLADARVDPGTAADAVLLPSESNDTWRIGPLVLRVCWRGDPGRLLREAEVAPHLPVRIGYPRLVSTGRAGDLTWTATRWIGGENLADLWPRLDRGDRRGAIGALADMLTALHAWSPPTSTSAARALATQRTDTVDLLDPGSVIGATINPLPLERAVALSGHARRLPFVGHRVIDETLDRLHLLARHDPYSAASRSAGPDAGIGDHVAVHGDAHLANLLWRDGRVAALLDFEWIRLGPRDLELEPFLRSTDWSGRADGPLAVDETARLFGWLAADYPLLFADPDLVERLWLYQLALTVRALCIQGAPAPAAQLPPDHPLNLLPFFLQGTDHLERVLTHVRV